MCVVYRIVQWIYVLLPRCSATFMLCTNTKAGNLKSWRELTIENPMAVCFVLSRSDNILWLSLSPSLSFIVYMFSIAKSSWLQIAQTNCALSLSFPLSLYRCGWTTNCIWVKRNCNLTTKERRRTKIKMTNHSNEWFNRNICYIFRLFVIVVCYFVSFRVFFHYFFSLACLLCLWLSFLFILYIVCIWFVAYWKHETVPFEMKIGRRFSRPLSMIFYQFDAKHVDDEMKWERKIIFFPSHRSWLGSCTSHFGEKLKAYCTVYTVILKR